MITSYLNKLWYDSSRPAQYVLRPISWIFQAIVCLRRWFLQKLFQQSFPVPILVVGNITLGGVGKTPLVIELAKQLRRKGLRVGIVSRGYKAKIGFFPYEVKTSDSALDVGDEPLLLALKTQCPVVIDPKRPRAVQYLLDKHCCQIIISDDGLQHYRMGRAIEIVVIDGIRGLGNGLCLPAGPLRETKKRLSRADFIIVNEGCYDNAFSMQLKPGKIKKLKTGETLSPGAIQTEFAAVAAIGHPQRFYSTLDQLGIQYKAYSYPDHYQFTQNDLKYAQSLIIMTEKDAVKCVSFNSDTIYYLPVEAVLNDAFWNALWTHEQLLGKC